MNKGLIAVCIKNTVVVICFTALAIIFEKWWIALFSMLLMTTYERTTSHKENNDGQADSRDT